MLQISVDGKSIWIYLVDAPLYIDILDGVFEYHIKENKIVYMKFISPKIKQTLYNRARILWNTPHYAKQLENVL